jgi:uncharacterized protein (DUF1501 family)/uncharacterized protein (DUF1800 family)
LLPAALKTSEMAGRIGAATTSSSIGFEACGSRGEVANNVFLGARYIGDSTIRYANQGLDRIYYFWSMGATYAWQTVVLYAKDQLRQRVAWAFSQYIIGVGADTPYSGNAEVLANYHDIFVHNAFGNYRDILREIAASPLMGSYLTFSGNRAFSVDQKFPDENFARELMQLFTIGLWELEINGTEKRNPSTGLRIPTYDNDDVFDAARMWTGWNVQPFRGNLLSVFILNLVDPMQLYVYDHDKFPKTTVTDRYLGDGYPLCTQLPQQAFLKRGAKYVLTGSISMIGEFYDKIGGNARKHYAPNRTTSALYAELCRKDSVTGKCTFPPVVALNKSLVCSGSVECGADTLRVVKVVDPVAKTTMYYYYEERPCVHMAFFDDGKYIQNRGQRQCADPKLVTIAGNMCCDSNSNILSNKGGECAYLAEPMKQTTAAARCSSLYSGGKLCPSTFVPHPQITRNENTDGSAIEWAQTCSAFQYRWSPDSCQIKIQVNSLGKVNIVDEMASFIRHMKTNSGNDIKVWWNKPRNASVTKLYPIVENGECRVTGCTVLPEKQGTCLCDFWIEMTPVFISVTNALPSPAAIRSRLKIGAFPPALYGTEYTKCTTAVCTAQPSVAVYTKGSSPTPAAFDADTIFEVTDSLGWQTKPRYLLNRESTVFIGYNPKTTKKIINSCIASSTYNIVSNGVYTYGCEKSYDSSLSSQWVSRSEGIGAWIKLTFTRPTIINVFKHSGRCSPSPTNKRLRLYFSDGTNQTVQASNDCLLQEYPIKSVTTTFVKVVIETLYASGVDTGIREIEFWGPDQAARSDFNFRNPPNFNPNVGAYSLTPNFDTRYQLYAPNTFESHVRHETDAYIDELLEHNNTGPFVARRLIQRLVTSNPSPRYIEAVATAFRSGAYGNRVFSGKHGDLAATVTAILLDREARTPILDADSTFGQMREPILKILHFMRSMEYTTKEGVEVMLQLMETRVGQDAYRYPNVFSFFLPDFSPDGVVASRGLVAPEAQLATAPNTVGYLNGMDSLIEYGLTSCKDGFGDNVQSAIKRNVCQNKFLSFTADGNLTYKLKASLRSNASGAIDELATLLTPGRLSVNTRRVMIQAYQNKSISDATALKQVFKLFAVAPEFHVTNKVEMETKKRAVTPDVPSGNRPYKAVVAILLGGGADSFNMVVPHTCSPYDLYGEYTTIRGGSLAIDKNSLLPIQVLSDSDSQPCSTFGLHPNLPFLQKAYNDKDAIVINNVGVMVEPLTKDDFFWGRKRVPLGNFGHGLYTLIQSLDALDASAKGIIGRMVSALQHLTTPMKCAMYSVYGANKILEGSFTPSIVQADQGVIRYKQYSRLKTDISALNKNTSTSMFAETFSDSLEASLKNTEVLGDLLGSTDIISGATFGTGQSLSAQLREVAKLIAVDTKNFQNERGGFVVSHQNYDTHHSFDDLARLLDELNSALDSFSKEVKLRGLWNNVTIIISSEFGRTLTSNSQGTDHGWGGNYFMLGGSVRGGRMLGRYPTRLTEEVSDVNIGRGRILPTTPWESVWNGIAEWWGIADKATIETVLPHAKNWAPDAMFQKSKLFE